MMRDTCPVCQGATVAFEFSKAGFDLSRCGDCGFLFTNPYPTPAQIEAYYTASYRGASADFYPKAASRMRRALVKSLRFIPHVMGKRVLDVGCGGGMMVKAFSLWSASASGLDISPGSIAYARKQYPKCHFYCESFADFAHRGETFDFVFSTELLEHLAGPEDFMEMLRTVTEPGGVVYIATPDAGHPAVPATVADWNDVCPPEHLQFFNATNIQILFKRYGFSLTKAFPKKTPAHSLLFRREAA